MVEVFIGSERCVNGRRAGQWRRGVGGGQWQENVRHRMRTRSRSIDFCAKWNMTIAMRLFEPGYWARIDRLNALNRLFTAHVKVSIIRLNVISSWQVIAIEARCSKSMSYRTLESKRKKEDTRTDGEYKSSLRTDENPLPVRSLKNSLSFKRIDIGVDCLLIEVLGWKRDWWWR